MPLTDESTILVPVDVSESHPLDRTVLDLVRPVDVVVLGYYLVPRQTAPAQSRADHESEARARLDDIAAEFAGADHDVEDVLVFTKGLQDTIDRVADQYDCDAVLVPGAYSPVERILVPLRGDVNLERIVSVVGQLVRVSDATVTLFHSVSEGTDPSQGEFVLRGAADRLAEEGVDSDRIEWELSEGGEPESAIVERAEGYDLVILGETEPSLRERIIGTDLSPILDRIEQPAIVVRDID